MGIVDFFRSLRLKADLHAGRTSALDELFRRYADGLFHYALTLTLDQDGAEDIVQQLFVDLAARPGALDNVYNLKSYLYQAVRNRSLNHKKRAQKETDELFEPECPGLAPDERLALQLALSSLNPEQREVVVLKIHHGLTFQEIGKAIGVPQNTAASRYRYALENLRGQLTASGKAAV